MLYRHRILSIPDLRQVVPGRLGKVRAGIHETAGFTVVLSEWESYTNLGVSNGKWYLPGTCLSTIFGFWTLEKKALSIQNKGHLGSRCTVYKKPNFLQFFFASYPICGRFPFWGIFFKSVAQPPTIQSKPRWANFMMKLQNQGESTFFWNRLMVKSREIKDMIPQRIDKCFVGHAVDLLFFVWINRCPLRSTWTIFFFVGAPPGTKWLFCSSLWKTLLEASACGGWFQRFFYFHRKLGKWSNLTNILQMGWNDKLVSFCGPMRWVSWHWMK